MEFELNGRSLKYEENGDIYIWCDIGSWKNNPKWKLVKIHNDNDTYKCMHIGDKIYKLHRIIGYLFLGLDIDDSEQYIDHIDGDRQNNNIENLRIVTNQQNCFNRTTAKGYSYDKKNKKYQSQISINRKNIHLGCFETEAEARQAYLDAKKLYHIIP